MRWKLKNVRSRFLFLPMYCPNCEMAFWLERVKYNNNGFEKCIRCSENLFHDKKIAIMSIHSGQRRGC